MRDVGADSAKRVVMNAEKVIVVYCLGEKILCGWMAGFILLVVVKTHGNGVHSEPSKAFKLDAVKVRMIRQSNASSAELADTLCVCRDSIVNVRSGKTWSNVV